MALFRAPSHATSALACFHTHHNILPRRAHEIERAPHTFHQHQHSHCRASIHTQCVQAHSTNSHNTRDSTRHAQTAPPAPFPSHPASATSAEPPKKFPQCPARSPPLSLQPSPLSSNNIARGREQDVHSQPQRRLRHREHHGQPHCTGRCNLSRLPRVQHPHNTPAPPPPPPPAAAAAQPSLHLTWRMPTGSSRYIQLHDCPVVDSHHDCLRCYQCTIAPYASQSTYVTSDHLCCTGLAQIQ